MLDMTLSIAAVVFVLSGRLPAFLRRWTVTLLLGVVLFREQAGVSPLGLPAFALTAALLVGANVVPFLLKPREKAKETVEKDARFEGLSQREKDVLSPLLVGKSQAEVAVELGLKPSTVGTYRKRAMEKLGAASLDDLREKAPDAEKGKQSAKRRWLPMAWAMATVMPLACWLGGLPVCAFVAALASASCAFLASDCEGDGLEASLSIALCLSLGIVLRGIAIGALPALWGIVPVVASMATALVLERLGICDSLECEGVWQLVPGLSMLVLGLCVGPVALETVNVMFAGLLLNWPLVLAASAVVAIATATLLTYLLLEEGNCHTSGVDGESALHILQGQGLSELEAQVLLAIARGEKTPEICARLSVATGTVNSYRLRGYRKLGIHSRHELAELLSRQLDAGNQVPGI